MSARDFPQRRLKYIKLSKRLRFGNLASDLNRVATGLAGGSYSENMPFWVEQAKHLAAWTAESTTSEEVAREVFEIHLALARFEQNINDEAERKIMMVQAKQWAERMIEHSGIMEEK